MNDEKTPAGRGAAHNSTWKDGLTYKDVKYESPYQLYKVADASRRISIGTFVTRLSVRRPDLSDAVIDECLYLSTSQYKEKYSARVTWCDIDGEKKPLGETYEALSAKTVQYSTFRQRVLKRGKSTPLTTELIAFAASATEDDWIARFGVGRSKQFTYAGALHPEIAGETFASFASFLKRINRYADRAHIRSRLAKGWDTDTALTEPSVAITSRDYTIYMVEQTSTGLRYVGLTVMGPALRFASHVRSAEGGSMAPFHCAIRNCGKDDFVVSTVEEGLTAENVAERERFWISHYNTTAPEGFNVREGGAMGASSGRKIEYQGEEFPSLVEAATILHERTGLALHVIHKRLANGKPLPKKARVHSKHPEAGTPEFRRWLGMKRRMDDSGQGFDPRWADYDIFSVDIGTPPTSGHRLNSIDDKLPIGPNNFVWLTAQETIDRMHGRPIEINGITYKSLQAVAKAYHIGASTLKNRISEQGMTIEEAVSKGMGATSRKGKPDIVIDGIPYGSVTAAAKAISTATGVSLEKVRYNIRKMLATPKS